MSQSKKDLITQAVLNQIPPDQNLYSGMTVDQVKSIWFYTMRQDEGLRLTTAGASAFELAGIESYLHPLNVKSVDTPWTSLVLELSKKMSCPYFLGVKVTNSRDYNGSYIRVYDDGISIWINLCGGIRDYLDRTPSRRHQD